MDPLRRRREKINLTKKKEGVEKDSAQINFRNKVERDMSLRRNERKSLS